MIFGKRLLGNRWSEITQKCIFFLNYEEEISIEGVNVRKE